MSTKIPLYSKLIALKDYVQLDILFNKTLWQMVLMSSLMIASLFIVVWLLNVTQFTLKGNILANRFLSYIPMILMVIPSFLQQFTSSWATYLRCHKKEPFLLNSICGGIAVSLSTFILGNLYGLYGITIGYCVIQVLFFPWGYHLYKSNKIKWHGK